MGVGHGVGLGVLAGGDPPSSGHVLDEDTAALWRFNEAVSNQGVHGYAAFAALKESRTFVPITSAQRPWIQGGPAGAVEEGATPQFSVYYNQSEGGSYGGMQVASIDSDFKDALKGTYTIEYFIYLRESPTTTATILFCGPASGVTEATNYLFNMSLNTSRQIFISWERGVNVTSSFSTTVAIPLNAWTHVGVVVTKTGSDAVIQLFVDGVLQATSGTLVAATGGTDSSLFWLIGTTSGQSFKGRLADLRVSSVARDAGELLASTAAKIHEDDEDTVEIWRFSEEPECLDLGPYGLHLGHWSSTFAADAPPITDPLFEGSEHSRHMGVDSNNGLYLSCPWRKDFVDVLQGDELTVEFWIQYDAEIPGNVVLFELGGYTSSDTEANNAQFTLSFTNSPEAGCMTVFWEHGAGTNVSMTTTATVIGTTSSQTRHHIAIKRYPNGGGAFDVDLYVDGVFAEQIGTAVEKPTGATTKDVYSQHRFGGSFSGTAFQGKLDDMRISSVARSGGEIAASAARG